MTVRGGGNPPESYYGLKAVGGMRSRRSLVTWILGIHQIQSQEWAGSGPWARNGPASDPKPAKSSCSGFQRFVSENKTSSERVLRVNQSWLSLTSRRGLFWTFLFSALSGLFLGCSVGYQIVWLRFNFRLSLLQFCWLWHFLHRIQFKLYLQRKGSRKK